MKYYIVKLLTNTAGQDASSVTVFTDDENKSARDKAIVSYHQTLAMYHNADDVLYAIVQLVNELGNCEIMEKVDHRVAPEPTPEPEEEPSEPVEE